MKCSLCDTKNPYDAERCSQCLFHRHYFYVAMHNFACVAISFLTVLERARIAKLDRPEENRALIEYLAEKGGVPEEVIKALLSWMPPGFIKEDGSLDTESFPFSMTE